MHPCNHPCTCMRACLPVCVGGGGKGYRTEAMMNCTID